MGSRRALWALVGLTLLWGYTWVVAKQGLAFAGPFAFSAQRATAGGLTFLVVVVLLGRPLTMRAPLKVCALGLIQTAAFLLLQSWALMSGGAGRTAILIYTMPIWTLMLAWIFLGEKVRGSQWLAAGSALVGLSLIVAPWQMEASVTSQFSAVAAALCWALGTVLMKRWRADLGEDLVGLTAWQLLFGAAPLWLASLLLNEAPTNWTSEYYVILAFMALASTALGWFLWFYVLGHLPAWQASLAVLGVPVVASLSSRIILDERLTWHELSGMLLIGFGLGLLSLLNWRAQRRSPLSSS